MPCYHGSTTTNNKEGIVKIKPQNHKKKKRTRVDNRPVDAFRQALNNNKRRNGMVKIGAIIDEIIVTRR